MITNQKVASMGRAIGGTQQVVKPTTPVAPSAGQRRYATMGATKPTAPKPAQPLVGMKSRLVTPNQPIKTPVMSQTTKPKSMTGLQMGKQYTSTNDSFNYNGQNVAVYGKGQTGSVGGTSQEQITADLASGKLTMPGTTWIVDQHGNLRTTTADKENLDWFLSRGYSLANGSGQLDQQDYYRMLRNGGDGGVMPIRGTPEYNAMMSNQYTPQIQTQVMPNITPLQQADNSYQMRLQSIMRQMMGYRF